MTLSQNLEKIIIIDFGSQFTQLIARRIRELNVYCEIISHKKISINKIDKTVKGLILSGGPLNVYENNKFSFDMKNDSSFPKRSRFKASIFEYNAF